MKRGFSPQKNVKVSTWKWTLESLNFNIINISKVLVGIFQIFPMVVPAQPRYNVGMPDVGQNIPFRHGVAQQVATHDPTLLQHLDGEGEGDG